MLRYIEKHLYLKLLKEDLRKIGINFVTAGLVGVFIYHIAGLKFSVMLFTAMWITCIGAICLIIGLYKGNKS